MSANITDQMARELHEAAIVIDGLTFVYNGPCRRLDPRSVTATNVTVSDPALDFSATLAEVTRTRAAISADPGVLLVQTAADIERAKREQRVGLIMGFQGSYALGTDLERVRLFRELGVRIIQLTYNHRTYAGDGCLEPVDGGLSRFGRQLVAELAAAGVVLDLSHVGRRTSLEAIAAAPLPPIVSHANPAALTDNPRNLTDEQIRAVAERGGVVGCCCWGPLCWKNRARPSLDDYLDHIDYVANLVGIDHVSIATDSACNDDFAWAQQHHLEFAASAPSIAGAYVERVSDRVEDAFPDGLPGFHHLQPITAGLLRRGYTRTDVEKVLGGNLMRVFRQVWGE